ncbi:MAG: XRE family transcriptional regulator [Prevotella sp.]|jgi:SOS-response transcriptional repressor LexA|nr:XRE family transcriptional regulator [Prevotella sp.]MCI1292416.1 XRE family transcriptional regulator [Prevotella sp.]
MVLERIKQYLDYKKISISAFEKSIGMSNASFRKSLKNKGAIGSDKLENILRVYSDLSPTWLFTGNGDMIEKHKFHKVFPQNETYDQDGFISEPAPITSYNIKSIPLVPLNTMTGVLASQQTIMKLKCEQYVIPAFSGADFLITVKGPSMLPAFRSGDIVACKRIPLDDLFFQWNNVYVLDTKQGAIIKRVKPGHDKRHILIVSDDPDYDPFELSYNDITSIALVVGGIRSTL